MSCAVVTAALAGCFGPATTTCADGTTCPTPEVCAPTGGGCVDPDRVAACDGQSEGANCTAAADGVCLGGVCTSTQWSATAVIGGSIAATSIGLAQSQGAVADALGNLYIADVNRHVVWRADPSGSITAVAGNGVTGFSGDGGDATVAQLSSPADVAVDGLGNLYIADNGNQRIRRVDSGGIITTIAGNGIESFSGDGGPAIDAALSSPNAVAVDGFGDVFIADTVNNAIRRVDAAGMITTIAGASRELTQPWGVAVDANGNVIIADSGNNRIVELDGSGNETTIAGTGSAGFAGDGGAATLAELDDPIHVAVDRDGAVYIADRGNNRVRRVSAGVIATAIGTGMAGFSGDGGPASAAQVSNAYGISADGTGNLYVADTGNFRIRRVDANGVITTAAGAGFPVSIANDSAATCAQLDNPQGVAADGSGSLYIADSSDNVVLRVDADGAITTVAGTRTSGFTGDGGPAIDAELATPDGVAVDSAGNIYIADTSNERIRRVDPSGMIETVAGNGVNGLGGDGGPATDAALAAPQRIAVDSAGDLYIADQGNNRVRRVDASGVITTFAGTGVRGFSGDGGPAGSAELDSPLAIAIDGNDIYIVDQSNARIRRVDATGTITTVAGDGNTGSAGDHGPATSAELDNPVGVAVDAQHQLYIADSDNQVIRRVDATGTITTLAGTLGIGGFVGDGGPATAAKLELPYDVAVGSDGTLFITDLSNQAIRRVDGAGIITTAAGAIDPGAMGAVGHAQLADPTALVVTPTATFFAGGSSGTLQALVAGAVEVVAGRYPQQDPTGVLARFGDSSFGSVSGVAYDVAAGLIYLTESTANRVRVVTIVDPAHATTWTIATLAGADGIAGFADGSGAMAEFRDPTGLLLDSTAAKLYVADTGNHVVRVIDTATGTVSTLAGTPATLGFYGDGGAATDALFHSPEALTECANGDFFIADTGNNRVRRIAAATGTITTVLGDGTASSSGEGGPASTLPVDAPRGLACDAIGNLFVTSRVAVRMLLADATGVVDGTGAVRTIYGSPPRATFPSSITRCLSGLTVVDPTTVFVTDSCAGMMVELQRQP
ncbi:MAG TPA: SMP-30/gluconolactonase/LRE family protein [Kofleriaceae bacterium]